ncbi:MAG: LysM peptidoglycan-binding domain-containing protein [Anaerolineaceae bacterium]|nr:LysM peptidoglycan-binding domain-containing protein [Anaerolineaceae bacterium]
MRRFNLTFFYLTLVLVIGAFLAVPFQVASADDPPTPAELISMVNQVRGANGHPALVEDGAIDSSAQAAAQIMAASDSCAHIGNASGRVAAAGYGGGARVWATENIACGPTLTSQQAVYSYWTDALHMLPMTEASYRSIGGGVAKSSSGWYYAVIEAAYTSGAATGNYDYGYNPPSTTNVQGTPIANAVSQLVMPVKIASPQADGSVVHVVLNGQSLWSIAIGYGVKINQIIALNKLAADNPMIFPNQKLLIHPAPSPTPKPTKTRTPVPPTSTPRPTSTRPPPTATYTITPTITPTPAPLIPGLPSFDSLDHKSLGISIIVICGLGLAVVFIASFRSKT